jgi:HAD superfamily hydrolase (TIGR01662 family)
MKLTTVLFDLGSTLLYSKDPWPPIFREADQALVTVLQKASIPLDGESFYSEFGGFLDAYYAERGGSTIEKTTDAALKELLARKGFPDIADTDIRVALDAMYTVTQKNWYLEDDAISTLEMLRQRGYRLGLISNASDDKNVQQLIDRYGLRQYFEYIITSAGCGIRKPDERIFQLALDHFRVRPGAAVMVGDTLEADILGANQIGIYSVWITRRLEVQGDGELAIQPQAVVGRLDQIPALLGELEEK